MLFYLFCNTGESPQNILKYLKSFMNGPNLDTVPAVIYIRAESPTRHGTTSQ